MRNKLAEQLIEVHEREKAAMAEQYKELLAEVGRERMEWRKERQELLTRIQMPEAAPALAFEPTSLDQYVPFDDDEAFHEAKQHNGD